MAKKENKKIIIKSSFVKRIISIIIIVVVVVPLFALTAFAKIGGRYCGLVIYLILAIYSFFEFLKNLKFSLWIKISFLVLPIILFLFPFQGIEKASLDPKNHYRIAELLKLPFLDWKFLLFNLLMPSLVFFDKNLVKDYKRGFFYWFLITVISILISFFFKFAFLLNSFNFWFFIFLIGIPIVVDVFSYLGGISLGKYLLKNKKLAPKISPNKTIIGFMTGCLFGFLYVFLLGYFVILNKEIIEKGIIFVIITSLFMPFLAVGGDLFFSLIKRVLKIKDYSSVLPGHGGILDRIDSWIFTFSFVALYFLF